MNILNLCCTIKHLDNIVHCYNSCEHAFTIYQHWENSHCLLNLFLFCCQDWIVILCKLIISCKTVPVADDWTAAPAPVAGAPVAAASWEPVAAPMAGAPVAAPMADDSMPAATGWD